MELVDYIREMIRLSFQGDVPGILFLAATYVFVMLTYSLVYQLRINRWPGTAGELVRTGTRKFGATEWATSDQDYIANALYTYQVNGSTYTGKKVSPWQVVASHNMRFILNRQLKSIERLPDGRVMVYYNPRNPKKSFLIKPGMVSLAFTATAAFLPLVLHWSHYG